MIKINFSSMIAGIIDIKKLVLVKKHLQVVVLWCQVLLLIVNVSALDFGYGDCQFYLSCDGGYWSASPSYVAFGEQQCSYVHKFRYNLLYITNQICNA